MKKLKTLRDYFGFVKADKIEATYPNEFNLKDALALKIEYLKTLDAQECSRQATIESKTSSLIGQAGIIFSLLSLFIANYITKFTVFPSWLQVVLLILFLITLFFYLVTIFQATRYMNIRKYSYGQRSTATVKEKYNDDKDFQIEEIKDLIYSIERNIKINDQKANNLLYAYRAFTAGTIGVGMLAVFLIAAVFFLPKPETPLIKLDNPVEIKGLDSTLDKMKSRPPVIIHDTIYIKK